MTAIFVLGGFIVPGLLAAPAFALFGIWMLLIGLILLRKTKATTAAEPEPSST